MAATLQVFYPCTRLGAIPRLVAEHVVVVAECVSPEGSILSVRSTSASEGGALSVIVGGERSTYSRLCPSLCGCTGFIIRLGGRAGLIRGCEYFS